MDDPHRRDPRWALVAAALLLLTAIGAYLVSAARDARNREAVDRTDRERIRARQVEIEADLEKARDERTRIEADLKSAREERREMLERLRSLPPR